MATEEGFFGFGKDATGAEARTPEMLVNSVETIRQAIQTSATATSTLITIAPGIYDFSADRVLDVTGRKITIRRQTDGRVVLKNVKLHLHLDTIDQILIQGIVFRSDGNDDNARDGILLAPTEDLSSAPATATNMARVRITHCSFDGYYDIGIDSHTSTAFPRLLATIDHCLFFDADPGGPATLINGLPAFVNRGAINIGSLEGPVTGGPQLASDSHVTVAYNVFVNVWRRCPRVSNGNFAHIFNNLLYHWGTGNDTNDKSNKTNSWLGVGVGHGDGVVGGGNNGRALIEGNRFIPDPDPIKMSLDKTIDIGPDTKVDVGTTLGRPNRFDDPNGVKRPTVTLPAPAEGFADLSVTPFTEVGSTRPAVLDANVIDWQDVVRTSGPRGGRVRSSPEFRHRLRVMNVVKNAP
jgi:hypothetical protein